MKTIHRLDGLKIPEGQYTTLLKLCYAYMHYWRVSVQMDTTIKLMQMESVTQKNKAIFDRYCDLASQAMTHGHRIDGFREQAALLFAELGEGTYQVNPFQITINSTGQVEQVSNGGYELVYQRREL